MFIKTFTFHELLRKKNILSWISFLGGTQTFQNIENRDTNYVHNLGKGDMKYVQDFQTLMTPHEKALKICVIENFFSK